MALADYRLCDMCNKKAFYDSELAYEFPPNDAPSLRVAGENQPGLALCYLGDWAVLCTDCAKTHQTQIVPRCTESKQEVMT